MIKNAVTKMSCMHIDVQWSLFNLCSVPLVLRRNGLCKVHLIV